MKQIFILIIKIYQRTLSPDHGIFRAKWPYGFCRFHPTCSQYAVDALQSHGSVKGSYLAAKRVLRCNPFSQPGVDHVPKL